MNTEAKEQLESQARRIHILLKKKKRLLRKAKKEVVPFKEPVLFLIKKNGRVHFYEKATKGLFKFKNSDDKVHGIFLDPSFQLTFDYGNKIFKGYICYEEEAYPYPQKPLVYASLLELSTDKILTDVKTWKTEELKAKSLLVKNVLWGVAIIILAYGAYRLLIPQDVSPPPVDVQTVAEIVKSTVNTTIQYVNPTVVR